MYYTDETKFAFIVPIYIVEEYLNIQNNMTVFIWDPSFLLNDCKTIKRELFEKKPWTNQFKYEDYSCAKDITKCKKTDYITIIYHSNQNQ